MGRAVPSQPVGPQSRRWGGVVLGKGVVFPLLCLLFLSYWEGGWSCLRSREICLFLGDTGLSPQILTSGLSIEGFSQLRTKTPRHSLESE